MRANFAVSVLYSLTGYERLLGVDDSVVIAKFENQSDAMGFARAVAARMGLPRDGLKRVYVIAGRSTKKNPSVALEISVA